MNALAAAAAKPVVQNIVPQSQNNDLGHQLIILANQTAEMLVSPERGAPWKYLFNDLPSQLNIGSSIPPIDVDDGSVWIQFPHHDYDTLAKVRSILALR